MTLSPEELQLKVQGYFAGQAVEAQSAIPKIAPEELQFKVTQYFAENPDPIAPPTVEENMGLPQGQPADASFVAPDAYQGNTPGSFRENLSFIPKGTTQKVVDAVTFDERMPRDGEVQGGDSFDNDFLEGTRRLAFNFIEGAKEFLPGMTLGTLEDPIGMAQALITFFPELSDKVSKALGTDKFKPDFSRLRHPAFKDKPLTPLLNNDQHNEEAGKSQEQIQEEAINELFENPFEVALAAAPLFKALKGKSGKAKAAEPVKPVKEAPIEPVERGTIKLEVGDVPKKTGQEVVKVGSGNKQTVEASPEGAKVEQGTLSLDRSPAGTSSIEAPKGEGKPSGESPVPPDGVPAKGLSSLDKGKALPSKGSEKTIGLSKIEQNRIRRDLDLDKLPPADKVTWERTLNEAKAGGHSETALEIAEQAIKSKRPITDVEHAGMVIKASELSDQYDVAIKGASKLVDEGNIKGAEFERGRAETILNQIDRLTEGTRLARRETARALSIGGMLIKRNDYSLATVTRRAKAAKGSKLTPKQTEAIHERVKVYDELEGRVKELEARHEQDLAKLERLEAQKITDRQSKKTRISSKASSSKSKILEERDHIKKQIEALGIRVNDITGATAEGSYLIGKLAVNYIKEGTTALDAVVRKVVTDLPDITARDVYQGLISKDPKIQKKARIAAVKKVAQLKTEAKLLLDIEKAEKGIFDKPKSKSPAPLEIRRLQKMLRDLRVEAYRSGVTSTRLERSIRTLNELQDQLANQYRAIKNKKSLDPPEIKSVKEKLASLRKELRVEDQLASLNEQLRTGEFIIKEKPKLKKITPELERKQIELKRAQREIAQAIADMEPKTPRWWFREIVNSLRELKATGDASATFRQSFFLLSRRPVVAGRSFGRATKAMFSEFKADQIDAAMRRAPHHYIREKSGLELTELDGKVTRREEMFGSNLLKKIPGLKHIFKGSQRHMTTMLNQMRVAAFDQFLMKNPNATHAELKAWANVVNVLSGRGDLGKASAFSNELSLFIFAPRFAVSRIQTPFMLLKHWKEPRIRMEIAKELVSTVMLGTTVLTLADLSGLEVGTDPREADWGKIRIGDTHIDIWAGVQQPMRVLARTGVALTDKNGITGKELTEREKDVNPMELLGRFAAFKFGPAVTNSLALFTGKTAVGEPVTKTEVAWKALLPIVVEDIIDAFKQEGIGRAGLTAGLAGLGVGVNTYEDSKSKTQRDIKKLVRAGEIEEARSKRTEWNIKHPDKRLLTPLSIRGLEVKKRQAERRKQKKERLKKQGEEAGRKIGN